jgi:hypothetical protein
MTQLPSKTFPLASLLLACMMLFCQMSAFHTTGHMVVARIAEIELEGSKMLQQMKEILAITGAFTKERDYPFIEAAPYPDDIKYIGVKTMNSWHFHDNYVNGQRKLTKGEISAANLPNDKENIVWATNNAKTVLRNTKLSLVDDRLNKSIYLRMLIHFYGDLHQPLHNVSLVNENFPKGDQGGNLFVLDLPGARDLHSLWDMCVKKYPDIQHPLSKAKFDQIDGIARSVMKAYPRENERIQKRLDITSVNDISQESIDLAIEYVYNGVEHGGVPSEEYLERGRTLIDEQLAVAGFRLTDSLRKLFANEDVLMPHVKQSKKSLLDNIEQTKANLE